MLILALAKLFLVHNKNQQWIVLFAINIHWFLNISASTTILKFNYVLWSIHAHYNVDFISTGCNEYAYNVDIKLKLGFKIGLVHIRKQQCNVSKLFARTHAMLNVIKSTILKFNWIPWFSHNHNYIRAIHTTLYRVCYIEYTWIFVNVQFYAVLCIFFFFFFFLEFKQFDRM